MRPDSCLSSSPWHGSPFTPEASQAENKDYPPQTLPAGDSCLSLTESFLAEKNIVPQRRFASFIQRKTIWLRQKRLGKEPAASYENAQKHPILTVPASSQRRCPEIKRLFACFRNHSCLRCKTLCSSSESKREPLKNPMLLTAPQKSGRESGIFDVIPVFFASAPLFFWLFPRQIANVQPPGPISEGCKNEKCVFTPLFP